MSYSLSPDPSNPPVILDTDLASDVGDILALWQLLAMQANGSCSVIGIITDSANDYSADTAYACLKWWNVATTPIGAWQGSNPSGAPSASTYTQPTSQTYGTGKTRASYTDSTVAYRTILHNAADGSVVIIAIGFATTLAALLASPGDSVDARTGAQLFAAKVTRVVVGAGTWPASTPTPEFNIENDATNWAYVFAHAQGVQIVAGPLQVGAGFSIALPAAMPAWINPVAFACSTGNGGFSDTAWDSVSVFYGVLGSNGGQWQDGGINGTMAVDTGTGNNSWASTPNANQSYVTVASDTTFQTAINALLAQQWPGAPTVSATWKPTSISGNTLWADATQITGVSDAATLGAWNDEGPSNNSLLQATSANQPTYRKSGSRLINGRPVVQFGASSGVIMSTAAANWGTAFTVIAVVKADAAPTTAYSRIVETNFATHFALTASSDGSNWVAEVSNNFTGFNAETTNATILGFTFSAGSLDLYQDAHASGGSQTTPTAQNFSLNVGGYFGGTGYAFAGNIGEMLIWNRNLTLAELFQAMSYLNAKWATYSPTPQLAFPPPGAYAGVCVGLGIGLGL